MLAAKQPRSDESAWIKAEAHESRAIPLKLAPLLTPHRKHGKLSLRIERVAHQARLTQGRNNGDRTWSLASDELEDLEYLLPDDAGPHTLTIRIIATRGGEATTVAELDYPISPRAAISNLEFETAQGTDDELLRRAGEEIARLNAALDGRDRELAGLRESQERVHGKHTDRRVDVELAKARTEWHAELEAHIAEVTAHSTAELERHKKAWAAEQDMRIAKIKDLAGRELAGAEAQHSQAVRALTQLREESERIATAADAELRTLRATLAQREAALKATPDINQQRNAWKAEQDARTADLQARAKKELSDATETSRREKASALRELEQSWNARFAAAEAQWQGEREAMQRSEVDTAVLRKAWKADEDLRVSKLQAQAQRELADAKETLSREKNDALRELDHSWNARFAAEEAKWLADRDASSRNAPDTAVLRKAWKADEDLRVSKLQAQAQKELLDAKEALSREKDAALREMERSWNARLATAEAQWQAERVRDRSDAAKRLERAESALVEAKAGRSIASDPDNTEVLRLRETCTDLRASLALRDEEVARLRASEEQARKRRLHESQLGLSKAMGDPNGRQEELTHALADATDRYRAAESALAAIRRQRDQGHTRGLNDGVDQLHAEIAALQATIHRRDDRIAELRGQLAPAEPEDGEKKNTMVRDVLIVVALVAGLGLSYPFVVPYLPDSWGLSGSTPAPEPVQVHTPPPAPVLPPRPPEETATIARNTILRAEASTSANEVAAIESGVKVVVMGHDGSWTHIRIDPQDATSATQEGWVLTSRLKDDSAAAN